SPKEARTFLNKLRMILEYLKVFDGELEGAMRVDANISIAGGARVEIKNISSFKGVERALNYEIMRQKNLLKRGKAVVRETRHFDESQEITVSLRSKEEEQDYRYFPEPDLPVIYTSELVKEVEGTLPEMPEEKRERLKREYGITENYAKVLILDLKMADYFEEVAKLVDPKLAVTWVVDVLRGELNYRDWTFYDCFKVFSPEEFAKLLKLFIEERITEKGVVEVIRTKLDKGGEIEKIVAEKGLFAIPKFEIERFCREAIEENPKAVQDYYSGKKQALNFLVGQVMKKTRGRADPEETAKILARILG
ncbi:MAG: Asp-tRNA(Asn)/Glu-tRNA(Gln) amidotransferase subunit GatB, partial [Archaeoglobaceae archaeon]